jgi:adenylate cyclase class 2
MDNIEVEVKLIVRDLETIRDKVLASGGKQIHPEVLQRTVRLDTPEGDLQKKGIFLRVRTGDISVITLKSKKDNSVYKSSLELETEVKSAEMAENIFRGLGYTEELIMEKYREDFELGDTVVSLDRLPFGNFVEVEGEPDKIEAVIKLLELESEERSTATYWHLHEEFNKANNLTDENIIFAK